jgi:hypothetical protein
MTAGAATPGSDTGTGLHDSRDAIANANRAASGETVAPSSQDERINAVHCLRHFETTEQRFSREQQPFSRCASAGCDPCVGAGGRAGRPDLAGGAILTMDDAAMPAEAVAAKGGRIIAVGTAGQVLALRGPETEVIDLAGRAMVPEFVDPHGHIVLGGLQALSANLLPPPTVRATSIAALQQTLRDWVAANADAVAKANLIVGFGYDNAQLEELRHPTRDDLDAVSTDVPVIVVHQSGHLATMNSKALERARVTTDSPARPAA